MAVDDRRTTRRASRRTDVYYRGERVRTSPPTAVIGVAVEHATIDYRMAEGRGERSLAVVDGPEGRTRATTTSRGAPDCCDEAP